MTLHMLTHGAMRGCGLTSWAVCIYDKFRDIRERSITIRSEIWTTNIRSLGFRNIRVCDIMKVDSTEIRVYMDTGVPFNILLRSSDLTNNQQDEGTSDLTIDWGANQCRSLESQQANMWASELEAPNLFLTL